MLACNVGIPPNQTKPLLSVKVGADEPVVNCIVVSSILVSQAVKVISVIALLVNILTGLVKLPIKALADKLNDYTKVTRFIVFLPIGFGFLLSFLYVKYMVGTFSFNRAFATMWLTASSLSLTFYAIFEKLFPSKKKLLSDCEIKTSETILANIKIKLMN